MATSVSWNGSTYSVPASGERAWGASLSAYLVSIASGALSKAGGSFSLTSADVDWGATYGHKAVKFASRNTPATTGIFRLGNDEAIAWRNAANSADLALKATGLDLLQFGGNNVIVAGLGMILNADVSASAAIAYSKLATLTVSRALASDGSGFVSVSTTTSTELDYLSGVTSAVQTQIDGKQAADSDLTALAGLSSTGLISRTGSGTAAVRTLTAGSNKLGVTDGNGVSGNPTVDVNEANLTLDNVGGTLGIAKGGSGQTTAAAAFKALAQYSAKGDLPGYNGSAAGILAVGADGTVLSADSASTFGLKWVTPLTNPMTTTGDIIVGGASGAATRLAIGASGTVLKGGSTPSWASIVNADVSASAAIAYSKLNLTGSIVAADFASGAEVTQSVRGVVKSAGQLKATNTNDTAGTGYVGEMVSRTRVRSSSVSLTNNTAKNVTATVFALDPGDWLVTAWVGFDAASATAVTVYAAGISTTADTLPGADTLAVPTSGEVRVQHRQASATNGGDVTLQIPSYRVTVASATTLSLNLVALCTFSGTCNAYGRIEAWRVR